MKGNWITIFFFYLLFSFLFIIIIGDIKLLFNDFLGFISANSLLIVVAIITTKIYWTVNFAVLRNKTIHK